MHGRERACARRLRRSRRRHRRSGSGAGRGRGGGREAGIGRLPRIWACGSAAPPQAATIMVVGHAACQECRRPRHTARGRASLRQPPHEPRDLLGRVQRPRRRHHKGCTRVRGCRGCRRHRCPTAADTDAMRTASSRSRSRSRSHSRSGSCSGRSGGSSSSRSTRSVVGMEAAEHCRRPRHTARGCASLRQPLHEPRDLLGRVQPPGRRHHHVGRRLALPLLGRLAAVRPHRLARHPVAPSPPPPSSSSSSSPTRWVRRRHLERLPQPLVLGELGADVRFRDGHAAAAALLRRRDGQPVRRGERAARCCCAGAPFGVGIHRPIGCCCTWRAKCRSQ